MSLIDSWPLRLAERVASRASFYFCLQQSFLTTQRKSVSTRRFSLGTEVPPDESGPKSGRYVFETSRLRPSSPPHVHPSSAAACGPSLRWWALFFTWPGGRGRHSGACLTFSAPPIGARSCMCTLATNKTPGFASITHGSIRPLTPVQHTCTLAAGF